MLSCRDLVLVSTLPGKGSLYYKLVVNPTPFLFTGCLGKVKLTVNISFWRGEQERLWWRGRGYSHQSPH